MNPDLHEWENQYCSECFMKMWRQRLLSPFLPISNFTDYLIEQFNSIQSDCSTTMPYTTSASTLYVGTTKAISNATTTTAGTTTTCTGEWIQPLVTTLSCNQVSDLYNVSTGDLRAATDDPFCGIDIEVCLPNPCPIAIINRYGTTW